MTKSPKWKALLNPFTLDNFTKKDIFIGLGIATFAMIGIFMTSLALRFIEITSISVNVKSLAYYTGLIFLSSGYEELIFRCIILTILVKTFKNPWVAI